MAKDFLKRKMRKKNDLQLRHVIQNQHQFSSKEIQIAKELLNERDDIPNQAASIEKDAEGTAPKSFHEDPVNPKYSLRAVATYQLVSALIILPKFFNISGEFSLTSILSLAFLFLLYSATLVSAILIFRKKQLGLFIGLFTNLFQTIQVHIGGIIFYATGFMHGFFTIGNPTGFSMTFFNAMTKLSFNEQTEAAYFGINIVALVALSLIYKASKYWDKNEEFPMHLY